MSGSKGLVLSKIETLGLVLRQARVCTHELPDEIWDAYVDLRETVERSDL
ncbi:Uncharacterised protein (plasmid) [Tsukamurella tyrosinosolvens]|uniref:Uncharacterized protein n=1 Tax=Tsukamurella tyrosinosolvens TaxID=57704 RepID=A0A1H4U9P2_TSUTY|nr:hypothetical protein [Tsukamurella tyrosinosolvens]SEC65466.1 hypothetical protein SAMN04489793_2826 [Tsukamurella tyrosinosolvens]VEH94077.1 Uncharacterised protein [Tsukamurella tyrosinosolvens]